MQGIEKKNRNISHINFFMSKILPKENTKILFAQEENQINWNEVLVKFKQNLGSDIYESWIKNINLKKEYNHYVILSAPTRFVRDWIVSRYADKILDIIKTFKKSIQRIEFQIEESLEKSEKSDDKFKKTQIREFRIYLVKTHF